jgi:hypothetical protein
MDKSSGFCAKRAVYEADKQTDTKNQAAGISL